MINIKDFVSDWKEEIGLKVQSLPKRPTLTIIQVGSLEASNRYVNNKIKDCNEVGIDVNHKVFDPECTTTYDICEYIKRTDSNGIIVQLPLPYFIDVDKITDTIPLEADVDGFKLKSPFTPCTPGGIMEYLNENDFEFRGANAVVIGRSNIVGKPMARLLLEEDCTVTVCHSKTKGLKEYLKNADLVVCAVGKRGVIHSSDAPNAFIVDVGINFNDEGKLCGDVIVDKGDEDRVTPVPGGVGLLTRCMLLENTVKASSYKS